MFSNESDRAQEDEKIYIFPTDDLEQRRTAIEDEINTKRKEKIIESIVQKLIEEFALGRIFIYPRCVEHPEENAKPPACPE